MRPGFVLRMAWREGRSSRRRLGLYMFAVTLGVAALVAISSFNADVSISVRRQARSLLGADLELRSNRPMPDTVEVLVDSLVATGWEPARVTSFGSMGLVERTGLTRLLNVRGIAGGFPFYGSIETDPTDAWTAFRDGANVLVDPAVLVHLDARIGDSIKIGLATFRIFGVVNSFPGDIGLRAALGPRVFLPLEYLRDTGLLSFGSRASYRVYLRSPSNQQLQDFLNGYNQLLETEQISYDTVKDRERNLTQSLTNFGKFLGLVGLAALLLGGVGVASAVHVFVKEKVTTVAVLRCLGATQPTVFQTYLLQAVALGALGSLAGVVLGLAVQANLPTVLADFLPTGIEPTVHPESVLAGFAIGVWVAFIFALLPLLQIRNVTPLRALRRDLPEMRTRRGLFRDRPRLLAYTTLAVSLIMLSLWQAPNRGLGLLFAGGITATAVLLWLVSKALIWSTRRLFPRRARYVIRQGVANLFRPQNQTSAVVIALGFGAYLISTIYIVQRNLLDRFAFDTSPDRPNLVLFDIQPDQRDPLMEILESRRLPQLKMTPIVPARIARINGRSIEEILADSSGPIVSRWALRRQYRHTYRAEVTESEEIVAGDWWDGPTTPGSGLPRISVEEDLAEELQVTLGDSITWDVQGVMVTTEVTSLRSVDWAQFDTNFFVVFEPGVIDEAPQQLVVFTRIVDPTARAVLQRDVVRAFPNVSAVDLASVQETLDSVLTKVALAVRFMALFSLVGGLLVLLGSLATTRYQRMQESVLLKTMGARSGQIRQILLAEYLALGALAGLSGIVLSGVAGWGLTRFMFELDFSLPIGPMAALWITVVLITMVVGWGNSRKVIRRKPLVVIRELAE